MEHRENTGNGRFDQTILTIPKPYHENWALMTPTERGRFCKVCSKTVTDFTNNSREEIIHAITSANEQICGNIPSYHLAEVIHAKNHRFNCRSLFLGLLTLFGMSIATADKVNAQYFQKTSVTSSQDSTTEITGTIIDASTRKPLDYVSIQIKLNGIVVCQTLSDDKGEFSSNPLKTAGHYTIEASYAGYGSLMIYDVEVMEGTTINVQIAMKPSQNYVLGLVIQQRANMIDQTGTSGKTFGRNELRRMGY